MGEEKGGGSRTAGRRKRRNVLGEAHRGGGREDAGGAEAPRRWEGAPTTPPPGWPGPAGRLPSARLPRGNLDSPPTAGADPGVLGGKPQRGGGGLDVPRGFRERARPRRDAPLGRLRCGKLSRPVGICRCLCTWLLTWRAVAVEGAHRREGRTDGKTEGRVRPWPILCSPGDSQALVLVRLNPRTHEATVEAAENVGFVQLVPDGSPVKTWKSAFQRFPLILLLG